MTLAVFVFVVVLMVRLCVRSTKKCLKIKINSFNFKNEIKYAYLV